jgi:hypothetical protein
VQTAHSDKIFGLAFPANYGEVFATCSAGGIRVWHLAGCRELLRISLPNLDCKCVTFAPVRQSRVSDCCDSLPHMSAGIGLSACVPPVTAALCM